MARCIHSMFLMEIFEANKVKKISWKKEYIMLCVNFQIKLVTKSMIIVSVGHVCRPLSMNKLTSFLLSRTSLLNLSGKV